MGGLKDQMPVTYGNFLVGSLALIGIYPLSGFYSKDLILESAYSTGGVGSIVFILGIMAAALTSIYSMKIIMLVFHGKTRLAADNFNHVQEAPSVMNVPLVVLVAGSFFSGMIGYYLLSINKPSGYFHNSVFNIHKLIHHLPLYIKLLPMIVGIGGIIAGVYWYKKVSVILKPQLKDLPKRRGFFACAQNNITYFIENLLQNKYYFDEIYYCLIVKPMFILSKISDLFDQKIIDRFGPTGFAQVTNCFGSLVSKIQTGYIFNYTLYIVLFIAISITFFVINFVKGSLG
eukprot:gnl/Spiro4/7236_TR3781_c0_g1_i1.p1 gnl/Spiro4/7236_TR3781_c0_g1~~gnl/Spiro4/7236_TR3781_c0_g1_i1.p1  ORF type:complete len:329 (+),score=-50.04 gnl/Spiro4/7236_TR3781_c0_g1_i1:124-987(+)